MYFIGTPLFRLTGGIRRDAHFKPRAKPGARFKTLNYQRYPGSAEMAAERAMLKYQATRSICT
jgi:hypothetical protein